MKIDVNRELKELDGTVLENEKKELLTVKKVIVNALLANMPNETVSGEDKLKRFELSQRVHKADGLVDIKAEEATMIKDLVGKVFATLVVGQFFQIIEGKAEKV